VITRPAAETRRSLFRALSGVTHGTLTLLRPIQPPVRERGWRTWSFLEDQLHLQLLMQQEEVQRRKCDWHFCCALISRGRRLSARNSGTASPVEACHPQGIYYIKILSKINKMRMLYSVKRLSGNGVKINAIP